MNKLLIVFIGLLLIPFAIADQVNKDVALFVEVNNQTITLRCETGVFSFQATGQTQNLTYTCQTQFNQTVTYDNSSNSTGNVTCSVDYSEIQAAVSNSTISCLVDYDKIYGYFNDRTQNVLNTVRDEGDKVKETVSNYGDCSSSLSQTKDRLQDAEIRATTCSANQTVFGEQLTSVRKDNSILLVIAIVLASLLLISMLLSLTGILGRIKQGISKNAPTQPAPQYIEPPERR